MRRLFAVLSGHGEPQSPPFDLDNRGKRSVVLDLRSEQGRIDLHDLVATADVFLTNLRPDAVERLGFGPEVLLGAHDRLVYAQVSGFGRTGPDAQARKSGVSGKSASVRVDLGGRRSIKKK